MENEFLILMHDDGGIGDDEFPIVHEPKFYRNLIIIVIIITLFTVANEIL